MTTILNPLSELGSFFWFSQLEKVRHFDFQLLIISKGIFQPLSKGMHNFFMPLQAGLSTTPLLLGWKWPTPEGVWYGCLMYWLPIKVGVVFRGWEVMFLSVFIKYFLSGYAFRRQIEAKIQKGILRDHGHWIVYMYLVAPWLISKHFTDRIILHMFLVLIFSVPG